MRLILLLLVVLVASSGCAIYQAKTMEENIAQIKALEGSGCIYFRGNSRPWADVSMLTVATWGKNAPKYLECLQNIPPDARALLP
jgi:hypothetical protein